MKKNILLFAILAIVATIANGQVMLSGHVWGDDSNPLAGATVKIKETGKAVSTDANGFYKFENLKKGTYTVEASFIGYATQSKTVTVKKNTVVNFKLQSQASQLEEVVVSSLRADDKTPIAFQTLEKPQIELNNLAQDLPYILRITPSTVISSDAGNGVGYTQIRIRGTDLTRINVTVNGIPLNDAESHGVWWVDLPDIAESTEDIQVQRGVGTSTNGAGAFGATINIKTTKIKREPYAVLTNTYGSFNTMKNSVSFGTGAIKDHFSFNARLSRIHSDGYIDRARSDLKSFYLSGSYFTKKTVITGIIFSGFEETYQAWYGMPKASLDTNRTYNPYTYDNEVDHYLQTHYQLHFVHQLNSNIKLQLSGFYVKGGGYYEQYKDNESYEDYGLQPLIIGTDTITETDLIRRKWLDNDFYGVTYSATFDKGNFSSVLGGSWSNYEGWHFGRIIWMQYAGNTPIRYEWYRNVGYKQDFNIYYKAHYLIGEKLNLYGDMQYRHINYDISGTDDDLRTLSLLQPYDFFNPKAGFIYNISNRQNIYASFAVANREPKRSDFVDAPEDRQPKPETLYDYELGYKYSFSKMLFNVNLYYMDYRDQLIMTGEINDVGTPIMVNVPHSYRRGIELVWGFKPDDKIQWDANLTLSQNKILNYVDHVDDWDTWPQQVVDTLGTTDISFSPSVIGSSLLQLNLTKNLSVVWIAKYVGRQYIDNTSNIERSLDPYFVNDLNIQWTIKKQNLPEINLVLKVNNLLNEKYETFAWVYRYYYGGEEYVMDGYFPQAPRNYLLSLRLKF